MKKKSVIIIAFVLVFVMSAFPAFAADEIEVSEEFTELEAVEEITEDPEIEEVPDEEVPEETIEEDLFVEEELSADEDLPEDPDEELPEDTDEELSEDTEIPESVPEYEIPESVPEYEDLTEDVIDGLFPEIEGEDYVDLSTEEPGEEVEYIYDFASRIKDGSADISDLGLTEEDVLALMEYLSSVGYDPEGIVFESDENGNLLSVFVGVDFEDVEEEIEEEAEEASEDISIGSPEVTVSEEPGDVISESIPDEPVEMPVESPEHKDLSLVLAVVVIRIITKLL